MKMTSRHPEIQAVEVTSAQALEGFPGITSYNDHPCLVPGCTLVVATHNLLGGEEKILISRGEAIVYLPHDREYSYYDSWASVVREYQPMESAEPLEIPGQLSLDDEFPEHFTGVDLHR